MPLPELGSDGYLPPGIHAASMREVLARYAIHTPARERCGNLLRLIVGNAKSYPTIKRVLLWGSFVTAKPEPGDMDYSIIVEVGHKAAQVAVEHHRFFVPVIARQHYGVDVSYLRIYDYPFDIYLEKLDFVCQRRDKRKSGIVEISVRGEFATEATGEA